MVRHQDARRFGWFGQFIFNKAFQCFGLLSCQRHVVEKRSKRRLGFHRAFVQKSGGVHTSAPRAAENVGAGNALLAQPNTNRLGLLFTRIAQVALGGALTDHVACWVSISRRIGMPHQQDMLAIHQVLGQAGFGWRHRAKNAE